MQRQQDDIFLPTQETNGASNPESRRGSSQGRGRDDSRTSSGRREVVAMACQPCRKRKTKCDGQRPLCSACVHRGQTNCFYDSTSDMRRTSALKKRIEHLLDDITSLRNIILSLCRTYNIPQEPRLMSMIEQTLCQGRWSYLAELARVVEQHSLALKPGDTASEIPESHTQLLPLPDFQSMQRPLAYATDSFSPMAQTSAQSFPPAAAPSNWPALDERHVPAVSTDVGQMSYYMGPCTYRPAPYPVSSNAY